MSRYSLLWLKPADLRSSWTADSSSKLSADDTPQSSGFSYPPMQAPTSFSQGNPPIIPMSSVSSPNSSPPPPHPYQLAAYDSIQSPLDNSSIGTANNRTLQPQRNQIVSEADSEKPVDSTVGGQTYTTHSSQRPLTRPRSTRTRRTSIYTPPLPLTLRPILLLLIFLPLPPLLSLIYLVAGHAILRHIHPSPDSSYHAPLLSSVEAGATGGVILAVPLALVLYLLYGPTKPPTAPEDFFEDDDSVHSRSPVSRYSGYLACFLLLVGVGGVSGPLGATVLASGGMGALIQVKKMLSPGAATAAGMLGGIVIISGVAMVSAAVLLGWAFWLKRKPPPRPS